ncbi:MAG: hypothetical protein ACLRXQ_10340 [Phascolarctobacterium faecium]
MVSDKLIITDNSSTGGTRKYWSKICIMARTKYPGATGKRCCRNVEV